MAAAVAEVWGTPFFRGEIYDYAAKLDLQGGYAVKGTVDISTLRHLIEPLEAIRDPMCGWNRLRGRCRRRRV
jgi:hypothetical protein